MNPAYVVFDDKHIAITHKNGEPVKKEELVAEHRAQQAARKALRGRAAADPATWSLFEHLASEGKIVAFIARITTRDERKHLTAMLKKSIRAKKAA